MKQNLLTPFNPVFLIQLKIMGAEKTKWVSFEGKYKAKRSYKKKMNE
jgi:hypothetical protein